MLIYLSENVFILSFCYEKIGCASIGTHPIACCFLPLEILSPILCV